MEEHLGQKLEVKDHETWAVFLNPLHLAAHCKGEGMEIACS